MKKNRYKAFTLVELIIVITILAILALISFMSFKSYVSTTRDAVRSEDVSSIRKGLDIFYTVSGRYPDPNGVLQIATYSGAELFSQGKFGSELSTVIKSNVEFHDPLYTTKNYTYSVTNNRLQYQIGYMKENLVSATPFIYGTTYAENSSLVITGNYTGSILVNTGGVSQYYPLSNIITTTGVTGNVNITSLSSSIGQNGISALPFSYLDPVTIPTCNIGEDATTGVCKDPYWTNVTYLSHFDSDFNDYKGHFKFTTGTLGISNSTYKLGGGSAYFPGDGYLEQFIYGGSSSNIFGTSNFTVEFYVKPGASTYQILWGQYNFSGGPIVYINGVNSIGYGYYDSSYNLQANTYTSNLWDGSWHHLAFVRQGDMLYMYEDGIQKSSKALPVGYSLGLATSSWDHRLGANNSGGLRFTGYIDEFRVTKGVARYTSNFSSSLPTQGFANQ